MPSVFMIWNGIWAVLVTVQMKIMMYSSTSCGDQARNLFHGLQLLARMPAGYHSRIIIICCVSAPEPQGQSARFYKLAPQDTALIQKTLPSFL